MKISHKITMSLLTLLFTIGGIGSLAILHLQKQTANAQFEETAESVAVAIYYSLTQHMMEKDTLKSWNDIQNTVIWFK